MIEIAVDFLVMFFEHSRDEAEAMMDAFIDTYSIYYDEVAIHREMSYRMAAKVHYVEALNGSYETAHEWLVQSEHNQTPQMARSYFHKKYFTS